MSEILDKYEQTLSDSTTASSGAISDDSLTAEQEAFLGWWHDNHKFYTVADAFPFAHNAFLAGREFYQEELRSFAGVRALLQAILDEVYPPNTVVSSDKADADVGAQLTAAARKILQLEAELKARDTAQVQP